MNFPLCLWIDLRELRCLLFDFLDSFPRWDFDKFLASFQLSLATISRRQLNTIRFYLCFLFYHGLIKQKWSRDTLHTF